MTIKLMPLVKQLAGPDAPVLGRTQARIIRAILSGAAIQRDLAAELEVSPATVSKAITHLRAADLVNQGLKQALGPGRPVTTLNWTPTYALLGVSVAKVAQSTQYGPAAFNVFGTAISIDGQPLPGTEPNMILDMKDVYNGDEFVTELTKFISHIIDASGGAGSRFIGCGLTIGGLVNRGIPMRTGNRSVDSNRTDVFPPSAWDVSAATLVEELQRRLGIPVVLDNEATALATTTTLLGSHSQYEQTQNFALLAVLDESVGGALVVSGEVWRGKAGMAAEPGHIAVETAAQAELLHDGHTTNVTLHDPVVPHCRCGAEGHVEAFSTPRALLQRAAREGLISAAAELNELAARPLSDTRASLLFLQGGMALGRAITSAINWLTPEKVILHLPSALHETNPYLVGHFYLEALRAEIASSAFASGKDTPIVTVQSTDTAMRERITKSAAYLVLDEFLSQLSRADWRREAHLAL